MDDADNLADLLGQRQQQQQQQQEQDDNADPDDDHDEEDEDDEDGMDRDENRVLDGGVAGVSNVSTADDSSTAAPRRRAADCDIILYITCAESMDELVPNHPVLKEGVVVSIGLDKNTKLGAVFSRYTEFCNEHSSVGKHIDRVEANDLEFFHCQLLNGNDTAEASALMKNDRIKVRRERAAERETQAELKRIQRESDKEYFKQLRYLMAIGKDATRHCDIIFDCQGKIVDESGRNPRTLSTAVQGHSVTLSRRCKWLGSLIQTAREERASRSIVTVPHPDLEGVILADSDIGDRKDGDLPHSDDCIGFPKGNIVANTGSGLHDDAEEARSMSDMETDDDDDDDDDEIGVLPYPVPQNRVPEESLQLRGGAAEIENDEDNENNSVVATVVPADSERRKSRSRSKASKSFDIRDTEGNLLWVTIPNHSPEALKLLLEYCYTNRVLSLGHDAFVQACKTKPVKPNGPVSPFSSARRWPSNGAPQISFAVALAGIALAEEAHMPRLSLMCEVAASQLVNGSNVVDALSMCASQKMRSGNSLDRLREVAINVVLRCGPRGVYDTEGFKEALRGRTTSIIPTLFTGTVEVIASSEKHKHDTKLSGHKRDSAAISESYFVELDREDAYKRDKERRKRRLERNGIDPSQAAGQIINDDERDDIMHCDQVPSASWAAESARRSLKRMSQHLDVRGFHINRSGVHASRESFVSRFGGVARRRTNSRRRNSGRN